MIVRMTPCFSHRRPDVVTFDRRQTGRPSCRSLRDNSMSSMSGISGNPPIESNVVFRTNTAWSPVANPSSRERRFIKEATMRNSQ